MGNRVYLNTEDDQIAETNNTLPIFWLFGFEKNILTSINEQVRIILSDEYPVSNKYLEIKINIEEYLTNLQKNNNYIKIATLNISIDIQTSHTFTYLIDSEKNFSQTIYLVIDEFYDFYQDEEVVNEFSDFFDSIDKGEKTNLIDDSYPLGTTIGFD